jgi:hypothetical protein
LKILSSVLYDASLDGHRFFFFLGSHDLWLGCQKRFLLCSFFCKIQLGDEEGRKHLILSLFMPK